jgi:predicted transcriptional regulator
VKLADYFNVALDYLLGLAEDSAYGAFSPCPPFGERLKEVCAEFNVSLYRLKKITGISESVIRYWTSGKTQPSIKSIIKIADALGCSIDFLVGRGE